MNKIVKGLMIAGILGASLIAFTRTADAKDKDGNIVIVKGYAIDERALSGLYISIDELNGDDEGTEIEKVKKIVDSAIIKCGKSSRNFFGKKRNGLISLKEKHFLK